MYMFILKLRLGSCNNCTNLRLLNNVYCLSINLLKYFIEFSCFCSSSWEADFITPRRILNYTQTKLPSLNIGVELVWKFFYNRGIPKFLPWIRHFSGERKTCWNQNSVNFEKHEKLNVVQMYNASLWNELAG